ncbi:MAG TPA: RNA polymerase sigma factor [Tepidisphaeraceae bacterium]|jgi:RNA polymerase sigma-70 factor (ECF subfamily)
MDEEELLVLARRGDNAARTELVMRHGRRLFGLAAALLGGGDADVNDMVQETFLAAFDGGLKAFKGNASLATWFSGVLVNRVRKLRRYRHSRRAGPLDGVVERQPAADDPASRSPATQVEQRIDVAAMLEGLPPEYREVIVLREWQQMSYAEMASVLGVPERTAETRLTRARRMLRQRFGDYA